MRILIIGQCTLHWGRMEFGNIGNYYIIETSVRELHRVFPGAEIVTTFQLTDEFCQREKISCLPMELFYSWSENDLNNSLSELGIAQIYHDTAKLVSTTPFIEEVMKSGLVIDFSGEMWGAHAEPVGKNRFLVGLVKDRVAQLLNKPVVLLAGSQGPFTDENTLDFAKLVFKNFKVVANREATSYELLMNNGFDVSNVKNFACPAFLFEPKSDSEMSEIYKTENISTPLKKTVGYVLCGFNFIEGPYDKQPRRDEEFVSFAETVEFIVNNLGARVVLMSHQNGFLLSPNFKLINGRDYPIVKQLQSVVQKRGKIKNMEDVLCLNVPYTPKETKAIIKQFDMFVSGRVHAFVAAVSQNIPTVLITRGHGGISHRNIGFAKSVGLEGYIADPKSSRDMIQKINNCWFSRDELRDRLKTTIPEVQRIARKCFDAVGEIFYT
jgi:colanic acid/amylovoran biosynthesis protein